MGVVLFSIILDAGLLLLLNYEHVLILNEVCIRNVKRRKNCLIILLETVLLDLESALDKYCNSPYMIRMFF